VNLGMILIVSDDAAFARQVTANWAGDAEKPTLTLMSGDVCRHPASEEFDVAVVGGVSRTCMDSVLRFLLSTGKPVLLVGDAGLPLNTDAAALVIPQQEGWPHTLKLLTAQALRQAQAENRARRAEEALAQLDGQAALGRYMLEMRHVLNNALTAVLGNSELLSAEGSLNESSSGQVETIRTMAVRMHEILQRFTSLEKELNAIAKQERRKSKTKAQAAGT
jgi:signal transduction histidine kinase